MTSDLQPDDAAAQRYRMVARQLQKRGIENKRVLAAMRTVPRERFVSPDQLHNAYADSALPLAEGQTISQPFIVAFMTEALDPKPDSKVLEIGTGSGYQTCILATLCAHVYSVERLPNLHQRAALRLDDEGIRNVDLTIGDGSMGWPKHAPYDRIMVTAAGPQVPQPLIDQLADGGILIMPVGGPGCQNLMEVRRHGTQTTQTTRLACRFVKLVGLAGWDPDPGGAPA